MPKKCYPDFTEMGFKQAMTYVLDLLCYAYYVKDDNFVSDYCFDELEKVYCKLFDSETAPCKSMEREGAYSSGVKVVYHYAKKKGFQLKPITDISEEK